MTKKHYERVAQLLALIQHNPGDQATLTIAFARWFESENPRFSADRFYAAVDKHSETLRKSMAA